MMKRTLMVLMSFVILVGVGYGIFWLRWPMVSPVGRSDKRGVGYLEKYDFDSLRQRGGKVSRLVIEGGVTGVEKRRKDEVDFESNSFQFESGKKRITGMINVPRGPESKKMPLARYALR